MIWAMLGLLSQSGNIYREGFTALELATRAMAGT
jgi:hypothetical protein